MNIFWTKPTESGLADRLNDILFMATYARAYNGNVYINWPRFPAKDIDVAHRRTDILIENVLKFINFPKEVHFEHCPHVNKTFDHYIGGACSIEGFHHAYLKDICDYEKYFSIFKSVAADFTFCDLIKAHLANLPQKFVTFHIRRGDKVRLEKHDNTFINNHQLNFVDSATYKAIDLFVRLGYEDFFLCGDEDEKTRPFADYIKSKDKKIITLPEMPKWQSTYFDLATMTRSDYNIVSQRYSSFSYFPSKLRGITIDGPLGQGQNVFHTVFGLTDAKLI